jgi:methionyl-tRNA formyltransferase
MKNIIMKTRVIFMGTPDFAVPSLEALLSYDCEIAAVYTQPDKESGRGRQITSTPVKDMALSRGLPVIQPETLKDRDVVEQIADLRPDLIVVAAYGRLITPEILALPKFGCLAVHPSLLPQYRGASPVVAAILKGDAVTGVTIILMDKALDNGPVLTRREVSISVEDTTGSLTGRLAKLGAGLLVETIPEWLADRIAPQPQNETEATYTRVIAKEDGQMDWDLTALELWRKVRAYDPWPGCYTRWQGKRLKINKAVPLDGGAPEEAGRVITLLKGAGAAMGVKTRDGILGIMELQLEGKRAMTAEDFILGQRDFLGSCLP